MNNFKEYGCIKELEDCFYTVKKKLKEEDHLIKTHIADVEFAIEALISALDQRMNQIRNIAVSGVDTVEKYRIVTDFTNTYCEASQSHKDKLIEKGFSYKEGLIEHYYFIYDNKIEACSFNSSFIEHREEIEYSTDLENWVYVKEKEDATSTINNNSIWTMDTNKLEEPNPFSLEHCTDEEYAEVMKPSDKIYDSLETRTCENCSYYKFVPIFDENTREWCCTEPTVSKFVSLPPKDFGCNKF